jgi:hypothetical protein
MGLEFDFVEFSSGTENVFIPFEVQSGYSSNIFNNKWIQNS